MRVIEAEEQGFIGKLISHPTAKTVAEPILHALIWIPESTKVRVSTVIEAKS